MHAVRAPQCLATAGPWTPTVAGLNIRADKRAPVAGGTAGGSVGATAVPVVCDELWELGLGTEQLQAIDRSLGADVLACLAGSTALGTGHGDHTSVLHEGDKEGHHHWIIFLSYQGLSTCEVLREFDRVDMASVLALAGLTPEEIAALRGGPVELRHCLINDLQISALCLCLEMAGAIGAAKDVGALAVILSGPGPIIAVLAHDAEHICVLAAALSGAPAAAHVTPTHGPTCGARIESTKVT